MKTCSVEGCGGENKSNGFCKSHYWKWYRFGDPLWPTRKRDKRSDPLSLPLDIDFDLNIDKSGECWEWTGALFEGYGLLLVDGKTTFAHRHAWSLENGVIKKGLCICHHCDNRKCVNPDHLFSGTHGDNMRDKFLKGRNIKGEKHGQAKLKDAQVIEIKKLLAAGVKSKELGERFGVNKNTISAISRGQTWKHI